MNNHQQQNSLNQANNAKNDLPPRFKKMMMTQQRSQGSTEEVSLRPPANSMLNKPKPAVAVSTNKTSAQTGHGGGNNGAANNSSGNHAAGPLGPLLDAALPLNSLAAANHSSKSGSAPAAAGQKDASSRPGNEKQQRSPRMDAGPTKEEVLQQADVVLDDLLSHLSMETCVAALKQVKLVERFWPLVLARLMSRVLEKSDAERDLVSQLLVRLRKEESIVTLANFLDAYKELIGQLPEMEKDVPRAKSLLAGLAARAVMDELCTLAELAQPLEGGHQYPLFMLTLQQLYKSLGNDKTVLTKLFNNSKVQLMNTLPESDRNKERLGEILDDRGLGFLFPLLRIQSDLWKQIQADSTPAQFYKWIKENLDSSCHTVPAFISALFTVLLKYIAQEADAGSNHAGPLENGGGGGSSTDKTTQEKEKELLERYRPVLQAFLHDQVALQVTVLHSLQAFCHELNFPKGMLLRWFVLLYDAEIVEEDAFLKWREDITDVTPGKGKALFQVNPLPPI